MARTVAVPEGETTSFNTSNQLMGVCPPHMVIFANETLLIEELWVVNI